MTFRNATLLATFAVLFISPMCLGQKISPDKEKEPVAAKQTADESHQARLFAAFSKRLSGATLVGHFTIDGKSEKREERYKIEKVTKLEKGDYWLFKAGIKYGDKDVTVPMPLEVKWAANTPVITLNNVTIPKLGTFDARVLIDKNRYAGTWQHGKVGGLMFGRIERTDEAEAKKESSEAEAK